MNVKNLFSIKIGVGNDHRGVQHKWACLAITELVNNDDVITITWVNYGSDNDDRVDYPQYAHQVIAGIKKGIVDIGVLICGTGTGMAMVANRHHGIFAGVAWDVELAARLKREENGNVLVIPGDYVEPNSIKRFLHTWLFESFYDDRYRSRLKMFSSCGSKGKC